MNVGILSHTQKKKGKSVSHWMILHCCAGLGEQESSPPVECNQGEQ